MGQVGFPPVHELLADFHALQRWASSWSLWRSLLTLWQLVGASLSGLLLAMDNLFCFSQDEAKWSSAPGSALWP